jgi:hypothetical protein
VSGRATKLFNDGVLQATMTFHLSFTPEMVRLGCIELGPFR